MLKVVRNARISTKLTGTVAAALISLCVMGLIAILATRTIQTLGHDLYVQNNRMADIQMVLAVGIERAIGDVHSAPSELDLDQLKSKQTHFSKLVADIQKQLMSGIEAGADPALRAVADQISLRITAFAGEAKKVFDFSAAFAQPDAITAITTRVIPAEAAVEAALHQFHDLADRTGEMQVADMEATATAVSRLVIGLASSIILVLSVLAYAVVSRGVVRPMAAINRVMVQLAGGDATVYVPYTERSDEIGGMAQAVAVFKRNMIEADRIAAQQAAAREARSRRQDSMERHTEVFGTSVAGFMMTLTRSAGGMRRAAEAMANAATAVRDQAALTSEGAEKSSLDLTSVATAVEELTFSFVEISRQVTAAADVSRQAVQRAEASQSSIRDLAGSTSRIGDVVRLISDIAGQTNLLALNATIEAARAGEAGKGFAVVAGEVKALAAQTAKATADIASQINTVRGATEAAIAAMNEIGGMIAQMDQVSAAIATAVEQQGETTRAIAFNVQAVTKATVQSAQAMTEVVVVADQAGAASQEVITGAAGIGQETDTLRAEVDQFLVTVRSDSGERRRFERINGGSLSVTLRTSGHDGVGATVKDLSEGGIALVCSVAIALGSEISINLPEPGGTVTGKVVRVDNDGLGVEFRNDDSTRTLVSNLMQVLTRSNAA